VSLLYRRGKMIRKVDDRSLLEAIVEEAEKMAAADPDAPGTARGGPTEGPRAFRSSSSDAEGNPAEAEVVSHQPAMRRLIRAGCGILALPLGVRSFAA
jgi:hypothetical protein